MKSFVYKKSYNAPEVNRKEVMRYAGIKEDVDEASALLDRLLPEAEDALSYKLIYSRSKISVEGDIVDLGFVKTASHSLALCLKDCDEAVVFCATVGVAIDRLIARYSSVSPASAVMLQALGSERVESLCDRFCDELAMDTGRELRPRFSPGYGDLSLELQRDIFALLDPREIGVSLCDNLFMTPSKSVTAIIGLKREK